MAKTAQKAGTPVKGKTAAKPAKKAAPSKSAPESSMPRSLVENVPASADFMKNLLAAADRIPSVIAQVEASKKSGAISAARSYVVLYRIAERIGELLDPLSKYTNVLKSVDLPQIFETEGIPNVTLEEGYRVGISHTTRASVRPGQKEAAIEWLNNHDKGDLIQPTINASTLSSLAKQMMEEDNVELPDDIFNVALVPNTSVNKVK